VGSRHESCDENSSLAKLFVDQVEEWSVMCRFVLMSCLALTAHAVANSNFVLAAEVTMQEGVVVSAEKGKLVITDKKSTQHSYDVDTKVPVRVNGKMGRLEDLKKTMPVTVTVEKGGKVVQVATIDLMKKLAEGRRYWR
jgi:hypothetical protein